MHTSGYIKLIFDETLLIGRMRVIVMFRMYRGSDQSINQCLFSIQANNDNIHTFLNMNTERAGKEVILLI